MFLITGEGIVVIDGCTSKYWW